MSTDTRARLPGEAPRLKKPSWKDPRLLVGLLLVLASTAGVIALLDSQDTTTEVYSARRDIPVGSALSAEDLVAVPVRLGESAGAYLPVSEGIPDDAVATRLVTQGELVPSAALGSADELGRKPVGLSVEDPLPTGTAAGDRVDVWVSLRTDANTYEEPLLLLEAAEVAELTVGESALGARASTLVQVLVDDEAMPDLLGALSNDARIAVVLNPGAGS
ncbi:CpaB family protein [Arthrobacter sp. MDT1-65]